MPDVARGRPVVGILMGSDSDLPVMEQAADVLAQFGVPSEVRVLSAHRSPELVREYAEGAVDRGLKVLIAGAGGAAHLAGVLAAHTTLPVIGVPIMSKLKGVDSLLSTLQMPKGVPVATVAIDNAANAGLLAVQMLALGDGVLRGRLQAYKRELAEKTRQADERVRAGRAGGVPASPRSGSGTRR
jgi:5-(carboxyamino)imidazole ribonucleotide mutase